MKKNADKGYEKTKPKQTQYKPNQTRSEAEIPTGELLGILKPGTNPPAPNLVAGLSDGHNTRKTRIGISGNQRWYIDNLVV